MRRKNLLKQIAEGNKDSFEELYNEFAGRVYGYLKVRLADEFLVRDITQETFIAVWRSSPQYDACSSVSGWVIGIARHKMMDALRKRYMTIEEYTDLDEAGLGHTDDFTEQVADEAALQRALDSLPPDARELIHLVFNLQLSYKEVAELLEIPEGTVKSRMHYIKAAVRKKLGEEG